MNSFVSSVCRRLSLRSSATFSSKSARTAASSSCRRTLAASASSLSRSACRCWSRSTSTSCSSSMSRSLKLRRCARLSCAVVASVSCRARVSAAAISPTSAFRASICRCKTAFSWRSWASRSSTRRFSSRCFLVAASRSAFRRLFASCSDVTRLEFCCWCDCADASCCLMRSLSSARRRICAMMSALRLRSCAFSLSSQPTASMIDSFVFCDVDRMLSWRSVSCWMRPSMSMCLCVYVSMCLGTERESREIII